MIGYAALGVPVEYLLAASLMAIGRDLVCPPVKPGYGIFAGFF